MQLLITTSLSLILLDTQTQQWHRIHQGQGLYYGIAHHNGLIYVGARNRLVSSSVDRADERGEILVFDANLRQCGTLDAPFPLRDIHEIAWADEKLWVTCSYDNMVAIFDGTSWEKWYPLGMRSDEPTDVNHFNSFMFEEGQVWVLAHNYGNSELLHFNLATRELTQRIELGCCAHNIWRESGQLFSCSSKEGKLIGQHGFMLETGGFPRGVAFDEHTRCVGISQVAERGERDLTTGKVLMYDQHWVMNHEISLPREGLILDLLPLPAGFRSAGSWSMFSTSTSNSIFKKVQQMSSVFAIFKPEASKLRLGSPNDGGYVIADLRTQGANPYDLYLGAGVSDNTDFDNEFLRMHIGVPAICFDGTISGRPECMSNGIDFIQKNIAPNDSAQTTNLLSYVSGARNIFLKMDIEGAEWKWLNDFPESEFIRFKQVVLEFHGMTNNEWGACLEEKIKVFQKLLKHFNVIHAHGNNWGNLNLIDGDYVPDVLELTLLRKDVAVSELDLRVYPDEKLDSPNKLSSHDYEVSSISLICFYNWIQSKVISLGESRILTKTAEISDRDYIIAAKDAAIAAKDAAIAAKDAAIAAKDAAIAAINTDLAAKDAALIEVKQSLESRSQHIRHLEQHLHLHKVEINRLRQSIYAASWHTHLYRGWKRLVGHKQYNERPSRPLKRYTNLNVPWHTHLYRAGVGLFVKGERPWHAHLFRSWQSLRGDKRYAPRATTVTCVNSAPQADDAASPAKRFARYRDEAGI